MKTRPTGEHLIYGLIVVLSLIALALLALAPADLVAMAPVYKGF
ncbi:MAG TPA: hypothetical protein VG347_25560 [Verrucomicrobiae bacterium]|nr:hypothetical protein [Verrucomicrobiae bacterium]